LFIQKRFLFKRSKRIDNNTTTLRAKKLRGDYNIQTTKMFKPLRHL
jgi:hypothetical protein